MFGKLRRLLPIFVEWICQPYYECVKEVYVLVIDKKFCVSEVQIPLNIDRSPRKHYGQNKYVTEFNDFDNAVVRKIANRFYDKN